MAKKQNTTMWWVGGVLVLLVVAAMGINLWSRRVPSVSVSELETNNARVDVSSPVPEEFERMELESIDGVLYYPEGAPCVVLGLPLDGDDLVRLDDISVLADYQLVADYLAAEYPGVKFMVIQCNYDHEVAPNDAPAGYRDALWLSQLLDGVVMDETNFYLVSKKDRATEGEISTTFYNEPNFYERLPVIDNHTQAAEDVARQLAEELEGRWGLHYNSRDGLHYRVDYNGASFVKLEPVAGKAIDELEWDGIMTNN